ncbi:MAG: Gfo/Idh/MocA family protein, partial [Acidimicrobiales bacterium]
ADEMAARAAASDIAALVPFTYQHMPMFAETKTLIDNGFLGNPHHLNLRYFAEYGLDPRYVWRFDKELAGSGVTGDLGSHCLFYAEWLFGPIVQISAVTGTFVERDPRPDGTDYEQVEDSVLMTARYQNGALGTIQACSVSWEGTPFGQTHHIDVHGSDGTVYAFSDWDTIQEIKTVKTGESGPALEYEWRSRWPDVRTDTVHNTYRDVFRETDVMARRWLNDIAEGKASTPNLSAGARVQHLVEAVLTSAADDGPMIDVDPTNCP